jgi:hypothetical protein
MKSCGKCLEQARTRRHPTLRRSDCGGVCEERRISAVPRPLDGYGAMKHVFHAHPWCATTGNHSASVTRLVGPSLSGYETR